jgi:hypothetical protein
MKSTKMILAAAAMTGLLAGSAARASAATRPIGSSHTTVKKMASDSAKAGVRLAAEQEKGKHDCKGKNDCKGQGGCKSGDNGCKGKNSCKGHGGCKTNGEKKA